jgi:glycosyltransferase involved in cell wall biosynthesis
MTQHFRNPDHRQHQHSSQILHVVTCLDTGGTQTALYRLLSATNDRSVFGPTVISLMDFGSMGEPIRSLGIPVYALGMRPAHPATVLPAISRLVRHVAHQRPRLVQGWMYHANLLATLAHGLVPYKIDVIWNVRQSLYPSQSEKPMTSLAIRLGRWLSPTATRIVYNSWISASQHERMGYSAQRTVVIPNGFDVQHFAPRPGAGDLLRAAVGFASGSFLVGMIARYHPMKDHANFVRAAAIFSARRPDGRFVLVGPGVIASNHELATAVREAGLTDKVVCLGERHDIAEIVAGLDIVTSASYSEASPNAIGEAMAAGVPCVVTDVGDSARLVGDTGIAVAPRDPQALAAGWEKIASMAASARKMLGTAARRRVVEHFSHKAVSAMYEELYLSLIDTLPCAD